MKRLQLKAKDLLKAKFWTQAAHQALGKSVLAAITAQGTVSRNAAEHGVVVVVVNENMRIV